MTVIPKAHFQNLHHHCYCHHHPGHHRLLTHSHAPREKYPKKVCSIFVSEYYNTNLTLNLKNDDK